MSSSPTEPDGSRSLGARLRMARQARGMTQQAAADAMKVSRPLLVAMEKGTREIRPDELVAFGRLYGRQVNELLRPDPPVEALGAQFRVALGTNAAASNDQLNDLIDQLERLGDDYLYLSQQSGTSLPRQYPAALDITGLDPRQAGEDVADGERNRLGLGDAPVVQLREVLDDEVGVHVFAPPMPSQVAGLFVYAEPLGACVAINARHPRERQLWTLAHEYAHFLTARTRAEVTTLRRWERVPSQERFADSFAAYFLMPTGGLRRRFHDMSRSRGGELTPADLLQLCRVFGVSLQALTLRLEDLRLVPAGTYDRLIGRGFRPVDARRQLGLAETQADQELLPLRYRYLAVELFTDGSISEGQLARLLHTDRVRARRIVAVLGGSSDVGTDGAPEDIALTERAG